MFDIVCHNLVVECFKIKISVDYGVCFQTGPETKKRKK